MTCSRSFAYLLLLSILLSAVSCKKYPEGPLLSLKSKKARLAGEWQLEKVIRNGNDSTAYFIAYLGSNYRLIIKKHEVYWVQGNFPGDGTWRLDDKKEIIYFKPTSASAPESAYDILRLKSRELWLKNTDENGNITETHYMQ
jgi:hypothetical protein